MCAAALTLRWSCSVGTLKVRTVLVVVVEVAIHEPVSQPRSHNPGLATPTSQHGAACWSHEPTLQSPVGLLDAAAHGLAEVAHEPS